MLMSKANTSILKGLALHKPSSFHTRMFKHFLLSTPIAVPLAAFLLQASCDAQPAIFAGEGIGKISLEETRSSVHNKLGPPTNSFLWDTLPLRQETWVNKKSRSRLVVLFLAELDRVAQIETTSPKFLTPEGLSVKSPLSDINRHMDNDARLKILRSNSPGKSDIYWMVFDHKKGIAFFVKGSSKPRKEWKSTKIMVFSAGIEGPFWSRSAYRAGK